MADDHDSEAMAKQAASHRDNAARARQLALGLNDQRAEQGLAEYAADQEMRAAELAAEIAALNVASEVAAQEDQKIVAFWPQPENQKE